MVDLRVMLITCALTLEKCRDPSFADVETYKSHLDSLKRHRGVVYANVSLGERVLKASVERNY